MRKESKPKPTRFWYCSHCGNKYTNPIRLLFISCKCGRAMQPEYREDDKHANN